MPGYNTHVACCQMNICLHNTQGVSARSARKLAGDSPRILTSHSSAFHSMPADKGRPGRRGWGTTRGRPCAEPRCRPRNLSWRARCRTPRPPPPRPPPRPRLPGAAHTVGACAPCGRASWGTARKAAGRAGSRTCSLVSDAAAPCPGVSPLSPRPSCAPPPPSPAPLQAKRTAVASPTSAAAPQGAPEPEPAPERGPPSAGCSSASTLATTARHWRPSSGSSTGLPGSSARLRGRGQARGALAALGLHAKLALGQSHAQCRRSQRTADVSHTGEGAQDLT